MASRLSGAQKSLAPAQPAAATGGYWIGGLLCLVGIVALSFGLSPVIVSARTKPVVMEVPGEQPVDIRLPGAYIALCVTPALPPQIMDRIQDLQYTLTDEKDTRTYEVVKIPPRRFYSDKPETQFPLFQFILEETGKYRIKSNYPFEIDGPKVTAVLFHMDVGYVRTELFVGIGLFLVLGIAGLYIIRRTYKSKPA